MARITKPLTDKEIKEARPKEKEYKLFDGGGLYLSVTPAGGKWWRLKYRFDGKEKRLSLGTYPHTSLKAARAERDRMKSDIAAGIDPTEVRKEAKQIQKDEAIKIENTFEKLARRRLEKVRDSISEGHHKRQLTAFENDVFPFIGTMIINEIRASDIVGILHRMDERGARESARKLFYAISKTFKWAVANGKTSRSPAADIDLSEILGERSRQHYPTITDDKGIRGLLMGIEGYKGDFTTKQALRMLPYVFVRPFNIRHAEWSEIDLQMKRWSIPGEKMKTGHELIVPLTESVIGILEETKPFTGDGRYIFPSTRHRGTPMSDNTLRAALQRLGYTKNEIVPHGFRAMFSTVAHEKSGFAHEVIETQLAHSVGNSVSKAYNRAKYIDERVKLMQWWSSYLDKLKGGKA